MFLYNITRTPDSNFVSNKEYNEIIQHKPGKIKLNFDGIDGISTDTINSITVEAPTLEAAKSFIEQNPSHSKTKRFHSLREQYPMFSIVDVSDKDDGVLIPPINNHTYHNALPLFTLLNRNDTITQTLDYLFGSELAELYSKEVEEGLGNKYQENLDIFVKCILNPETTPVIYLDEKQTSKAIIEDFLTTIKEMTNNNLIRVLNSIILLVRDEDKEYTERAPMEYFGTICVEMGIF